MSVETGTDSDYGLLDTRYAIYFAPRPVQRAQALRRRMARPRPRSRRARAAARGRGHHARAAARDHRLPAPLRLPRHAEGTVHAGARARGRRAAGRRRGVRRRAPAACGSGCRSTSWRASWPWSRPSQRRSVDRLAADCVREFDRYRAPLTPRTATRRQPERLSAERARVSRALGLSLRLRPVPVPHDPDRPAGRAGARRGQGHPAGGPGLRIWPSRCRSTSWPCSRRPIAWHRSGSSPASRSAHEPRLGAPDHPRVGRLHRPDRRHDDHDGDDHRHQPAGDPGHGRRISARRSPRSQLTVTIFFGGFALGQLVWGPLSDRIGRKPGVLIGTVIYVVATVGCALAPDIDDPAAAARGRRASAPVPARCSAARSSATCSTGRRWPGCCRWRWPPSSPPRSWRRRSGP